VFGAKFLFAEPTSALTFYDLLVEAHSVLISDDWRQSDLRDKDGAHAVAEASDPLTLACGSTRTDASGSGDAVCATTDSAIHWCFSAIHLEDLASLYCLALQKARNTCVIHAASENPSAKCFAN
jgi:hypothetical protein